MHSIRVLLTLSLLQSCSFGRSLIDLSARGALCENKFLVNQPCNFVSENFTTTGLFPLDTVCSYTVFADSNQVIKLKFSTLSLVDGDKVSVYNGDTSSPDSLIGEYKNGDHIYDYVSVDGAITLVMTSTAATSSRGFAVECSRIPTSFSSTIQNQSTIVSNTKFDISNAVYLRYHTEFNVNLIIGDTFNVTGSLSIDDDSTASCSDSSLKIYDKNNALLDTKCGLNSQLSGTYKSSSLKVVMDLGKPNKPESQKDQNFNLVFTPFTSPTTTTTTTVPTTTTTTIAPTTTIPPVETTTTPGEATSTSAAIITGTTTTEKTPPTETTVSPTASATTTPNQEGLVNVEVYLGLWTGAIIDIYLDDVKVNHGPITVNKTKHFVARPGQIVLVKGLTGSGYCSTTVLTTDTHIDVVGNVIQLYCVVKSI